MTFPCAGHMVPSFKNPHWSFKVYKYDTHIHLLVSHFEPIWSPYGIVCRDIGHSRFLIFTPQGAMSAEPLVRVRLVQVCLSHCRVFATPQYPSIARTSDSFFRAHFPSFRTSYSFLIFFHTVFFLFLIFVIYML